MNHVANNLLNLSLPSSREDADLIKRAAAEIERLEAELTSCRESSASTHKRLVKCEGALQMIAKNSICVNRSVQIAKEALKP